MAAKKAGPKKQPTKAQGKNKPKEKANARAVVEEVAPTAAQQPGVSLKSLIKQGKSKGGVAADKAVDKASHHELFVATLKGHSDVINGVAFSRDGAALATACEDRVLRVFRTADIPSKNFTFRRKALTTGLVDIAFGGDTSQLAVLTKGTLNAAAIALFGGSGGLLEQMWEVRDVLNKQPGMLLRASKSGPPLFLACSPKASMAVVGGSGRLLAQIETSGLQNHGASMSPDGRLVAAATFTADVRVHEVKVDRSGTFQGTAKVMDLKAHTSQVMCVDFSPCGTRMVTASKDGTWRVWNVDVRYQLQEDPKAVLKAKLPLPAGRCFNLIAYGPGGVVAAAAAGTIWLLDARSGEVIQVIDDAHEGDTVSCMAWSPVEVALSATKRAHVLATGGQDKRVRLWRCPI